MDKKIIETGSNEIMTKLNKLGQLVDQFRTEEIAIRQQLRDIHHELKLDVDQCELKQRKIQDCLKNLQAF